MRGWRRLLLRLGALFGRRAACDCEPGVRLCPEGLRLWRRASAAYDDGLRAQMRRGRAVDPVAEAGAAWPAYQRARAAYEAHLAAAAERRKRRLVQ